MIRLCSQLALIGAIALFSATMAVAADKNATGGQGRGDLCQQGSSTECGWWWKLHKKPEEPEKKPKHRHEQHQAKAPAKPKKIDCKKPSQWETPCGFVDPGKSFAFQSKERDALRTEMVMNPNNPKSVRGFQEYNNWVLKQAIAVADMWKFNSVQDPSLNPAVDKPFSRFGLKLLQNEQDKSATSIYQMIRNENGIFVWFTRSDCAYCHGMIHTIQMLQKQTKIPVHNASLDATCMTGFSAENCLTGSKTLRPAAKLQVRTVPDLMLYLPHDETWIRLATGIVSLDTIEARIKLFVGGMRSAYENAVKNSQNNYSPNVDFLDKATMLQHLGMGKGVPDSKQSSSH